MKHTSLMVFSLLTIFTCAITSPRVLMAQTDSFDTPRSTASVSGTTGIASHDVTSSSDTNNTSLGDSRVVKTVPQTLPEYLAAIMHALVNLQLLVTLLISVALGWLLSGIFASALYRQGEPESAYGASRWAVFLGGLGCGLLSLSVHLFTHWIFFDYYVMYGLFVLITIVLFIGAVTYKPRAAA